MVTLLVRSNTGKKSSVIASHLYSERKCEYLTIHHNRQHLLGMTCELSVPKIHSLVDLGASDMPQKTGILCSCNSIVKYLT